MEHTCSAAQPDATAKNMMFASVDMLRTCYEYVLRQNCIATERTKNCRFSGQTQRHSLPQNASSAQPRRQFVPQAFFRKFSIIMFVAAVVAVPQNTFHSLYRPIRMSKYRCYEKTSYVSKAKLCRGIKKLYPMVNLN